MRIIRALRSWSKYANGEDIKNGDIVCYRTILTGIMVAEVAEVLNAKGKVVVKTVTGIKRRLPREILWKL